MAESTSANPKEKTTRPRAKPTRERVVRKQLTSARRGAATNEWSEDQVKGSGILEQRAAVRSVPSMQRQST